MECRVGCVERPDCALPQNGGRIADGYFVNYWANHSDCSSRGCVRDCLHNESAWNWSVNDADFTDEGGKGQYPSENGLICTDECSTESLVQMYQTTSKW